MAQQEKVEAPREAPAERQYLVYTGTADERIITAGDLKDNGFDGGEKVVFNRGNRFRVPVDDLPAEAADWIAKNDDDFKVK